MAAVHDLLVLSLVSEKPTHGYDIRQFLDTSYLAHCTSISTPQIYAVLRGLEQRGFVDAKEERDHNAPPRTVYTITSEGIDYLSRMLKDGDIVSQRVLFDFDTVLSAMGHIQGLGTEECLAVVRGRLVILERQLGDCQRAWETTCCLEPAPELARAVFNHRRGYLEGELRWLQELEKEIQENGWATFASSQNEGKALPR